MSLENDLHMENGDYSSFLTLTYEDEKIPMLYQDDIPYKMTLRKNDVKNFIQKLRRFFKKKKYGITRQVNMMITVGLTII